MLTLEGHESLVPFPSLPETGSAGRDHHALVLRSFGLYESDLNLDFEYTPRPLLVTRILELCTRDIGNEPLDQNFFWRLPVGKRIEGLLTLWCSQTSGKIPITFRCANSECRQESEVELSLDEIVELQEHAYRNEHVVVCCEDGSERSIVLRRPLGSDQLAWLKDVFFDQDEASRSMLATLELDGPMTAVSDGCLARVEQAFEKGDPLVYFTLQVECSECNSENLLQVDLETLSLRALRRAQACLLESVHRLATTYHWSEAQIFSVPHWRRSLYLQLIENTKNK